MVSYLIRRILLFIPTMLGATAVIFLVMALSPSSVIDVMLPPGGQMQPGQRAIREQYLQERYGLKNPAIVQYFRWLNNISPLGFDTWNRADAEVVSAKAEEIRQRSEKERELTASGADAIAIRKAVKAIDSRPDAGDIRLGMPSFKSPDLGQSFIQSRPVWPIIKEALPVTLILQLVSLPIAMAIALITGIAAASNRGKAKDASISIVLLALYSIPVIWIGVMAIGFLANVEYINWFPAGGLHDSAADQMTFFPTFSSGFHRGYLLDSVWHLFLPVICISYSTVAFYSKLTRTSLLETLGQDFVRTARAKGLSERIVLYRHALRNSLLPLITVAASFLPMLITGSVVVESIFNLNGMGQLVISSLRLNDRELFLSVSVMILLLELIGYLLADVLYVVADPRVSYDS